MKFKLKERLKKTKAADTPRKPDKFYRPPVSTPRKIGQIVIWAGLIFVFAVVGANFFLGSSSSDDAAPVVVEENPAAGLEGVEFAKVFTETYFTWKPTAEGWDAQMKKLAPMLADGLDETAGIVQADQTWESAPRNIRLQSIEETGENKALVMFSLEQRLTSGEETETANYTFAVPVAYADGYAVYDLPSFTAAPAAGEVEFEKLKGTVVDAATEGNIENFLPTFFQSYAVDTPDKLAYFFEAEGSDVKGLEGSVEFVEIESASIVVAGTGYDVLAQVVMAEPTTGSKFTSTYRLTITESGGRYVVTKLNQGVE